jgi:hypothetical protein
MLTDAKTSTLDRDSALSQTQITPAPAKSPVFTAPSVNTQNTKYYEFPLDQKQKYVQPYIFEQSTKNLNGEDQLEMAPV